MQSHNKSNVAGLLLLCFLRIYLAAMTPLFFAVTAQSKDGLQVIVTKYVELAFPNPDGKLRRFTDATSVAYGMDCFDDNTQQCKENLTLFPFKVFDNANLKTEFSQSGKIRFAFAKGKALPYLQTKIAKIFTQGISDVADLECQLYMYVKENETTDAVIVVSLSAPTQKKVVCMLVNFARVLGLSQTGNAPFSETWSKTILPMKNLSYDELMASADFQLTLNAVSVLSYIHSCSAIGPGMSRDAVIAELKENSVCLRELGKR